MEYTLSIILKDKNTGGITEIVKDTIISGNKYSYNIYLSHPNIYNVWGSTIYRIIDGEHIFLPPIEATSSNIFLANPPNLDSESFWGSFITQNTEDKKDGHLYLYYNDNIFIDIHLLYNYTPPNPIVNIKYEYKINNGDTTEFSPPITKTYIVNEDNTCDLSSISFYTYVNDSLVPTALQSDYSPLSWVTFNISDNTISFIFNSDENSVQEELNIIGITTIEGSNKGVTLATLKFIPLSGVVKDPDYWEIGEVYSYIDTNIGGEIVDSQYLTRVNSSNIFNTLTKKDNILFAGNYTRKILNLYNIKEIVDTLIESGNKFTIVEENQVVNSFLTNSTANGYSPNLDLPFENIRFFKYGETYMLGMVFQYNTGEHSDVYYLGNYSPSKDPYFISSISIYRPTVTLSLNSTIMDSLYSNGVIGVIPVIAKTSSLKKVQCQGFLNKTVKYETTNTYSASWRPHSIYNGYNNIIGDMPSSLYRDNTHYVSPVYDLCTINTPELEFGGNSPLYSSSNFTLRLLFNKQTVSRKFNLDLQNNGAYQLSGLQIDTDYLIPDSYSYSWKGFIDHGDKEPGTTDFINHTGNYNYYGNYDIFVWQRDKMGGEGPDSKVISKNIFVLYDLLNSTDMAAATPRDINISEIKVFNSDVSSVTRINSRSYLGNVDTIITYSGVGKAEDDLPEDISKWTYSLKNYYILKTWSETFPNDRPRSQGEMYAGYDKYGRCVDPVYISFKSSPHLVIALNSEDSDISNNLVSVVELIDNTVDFKDSEQEKIEASWIKCGNTVRVYPSTEMTVRWKEGDWYLGRFESLKTMPFSTDKYQSITTVISGFLMSKYNINARTDINRGNTNKSINRNNFNLHNSVYEQENNFFTYYYLDKDNISIDRQFKNTVMWSLPKIYGSEADAWCNIQDSNYLDLDGDKGELIALRRFNNKILAFQETGISQILYNENVQISTEGGTPIELANSGKVQGKRYLWENKGCQNRDAIAISQSGLYFIDSLNKTSFLIGDNTIMDVFTTANMRSWALSNLNKDWWCYYDEFSQEILFTNKNNCLAFDDTTKRFQCFLSYENVRFPLFLNGRTYLLQEGDSNIDWNINNIWRKNDNPYSIIKDKYVPLEIEIQASPEATKDKVFYTLEYRADAFTGDSVEYNKNATFNSIQVNTEYQNTGEVVLSNRICLPSNLKKKFRIWRIQIPRDSSNKIDRIRNPWCNIKLKALSEKVGKFIIHDMKMMYII